MLRFTIAATALVCGSTAVGACPEYLDHSMRKLHSSDQVNLCEVASGKPLLIVNTASHCGYTPQFKGLEALYQKYRERGLVVVGFSSNDFQQEAKDEANAAEVCYVNYGVTFTMLAPSQVTGNDANPVFRELAQQTRAPNWNFNKYVVDRSGKVVQHFDSNARPDSAVLEAALDKALEDQDT